ncbi:MAG: hypothetical protein F6J90_13775 [Moorea sp. SIOASIH]|uniref:hypothetical protein n=1 Tax=Moorena sp. SIOASIH TaxID=2607817 RepID=UPI0013B6FF3E|nr:hypothetical protein [Moorena sp. SIOASIH]NEO37334.1 hypothetical protein [Moorena sp. SIOASIH]
MYLTGDENCYSRFLLKVDSLPSTFNLQPSTFNLQPSTNFQPNLDRTPTANNLHAD